MTLAVEHAGGSVLKVFLSWSGDCSKQVATALKGWLPLVIQNLQPWMSNEDIAKGSSSMAAIEAALNESGFGIVCLTPDNLASQWTHFEAGCIKGMMRDGEARKVTAFLFRMRIADVSGPLVQLQATTQEKADLRRLVGDLNMAMPSPLPELILSQSFETYWPKLQDELDGISTPTLVPSSAAKRRNSDEILNEIVSTLRRQDHKLDALSLRIDDLSSMVTRREAGGRSAESRNNVRLRRELARHNVSSAESLLRMLLSKNGFDEDCTVNLEQGKIAAYIEVGDALSDTRISEIASVIDPYRPELGIDEITYVRSLERFR